MDFINLVIDSKRISTAAGTTVLAAARSAGIYIPTLCSHPNLPPAALEKPVKNIFQKGNKINNTQTDKTAKKCGMCIVEIQGQKELLSSCVAQVQEGMVVTTDNKKIKEERKNNLIPILSRHRHACLTCAQQEGCSQTQCSSNVPENERCCANFGNCELRSLVNFVGISDRTPKWIPSALHAINNEPLFTIDYNLCIGCTRCVRACNKLRGVGAIGFVWDNQDIIQVGTLAKNLPDSDCKFCTACVEVCPTGTLQDKSISIGKKEEDIVPCKNTCPVHIDIPEYLRMISMNKFDAANAIIREKVPFPAVLGRICMHPCEDVCRRKEVNAPIAICALKRFTTDITKNSTHSKTILNITPESGKKVIIVGAGPTGLSASFYLQKKGHAVTLYDENSKAGGMMRYGIPSYRLPSQILDIEIENILALGIKFKPNKTMGKDFDLEFLINKGANAILIALGAQNDRQISIEGSNLNGVLGGISFLRNIAKKKNMKIGQNIVVIGGGNVAIDIAMTAMRCGAKNVSIVCLESEHEMPANDWEIEAAKSEGIRILPSWVPKKIIGKNKHVIGLDLVRCTHVFDESGIFNPQCDNETKKNINTDQILMGIGQETDIAFLNSTGISTNNGLIIVNKNTLETTLPGVYSGGDVTAMPGSVISSIASGRKVAKAIDIALGGTGIIDETLLAKTTINHDIGRTKGFAKLIREKEIETEPKTRSRNFDEIVLGFDKKQAIMEAKRCLQCDLRLDLSHNPSPPDKLLILTAEILDITIPNETEGVYKLFDENKNIIAIKGTPTLRHDLVNALKKNTAMFFEFEEDKMYSKRESEIIQKHLQEFGEMPGGDEEMDELF